MIMFNLLMLFLKAQIHPEQKPLNVNGCNLLVLDSNNNVLFKDTCRAVTHSAFEVVQRLIH